MIRFPQKVVSIVKLITKTKNWPTALADHAGLKKNKYICRARSGQKFTIRPGTDDSRIFSRFMCKAAILWQQSNQEQQLSTLGLTLVVSACSALAKPQRSLPANRIPKTSES